MRIVWNGTVASHRTLLFFDEISDRKIKSSNAFNDIYESYSGTLVCSDNNMWIHQLWFFADGTPINKNPYTIDTKKKIFPDIARVHRKRGTPGFPEQPEYNGLWSCQRFSRDNKDRREESLYVGVYERQGIRPGMLATGWIKKLGLKRPHPLMHQSKF